MVPKPPGMVTQSYLINNPIPTYLFFMRGRENILNKRCKDGVMYDLCYLSRPEWIMPA